MNLKRVSCNLDACGWSLLLLLLLLLVQLAASHKATCPHKCIPLTHCPELASLLTHITPAKIRALKNATCSTETKIPTVCCPEVATTPPSTTPEPEPTPTMDPETEPTPTMDPDSTTTPTTDPEPKTTPPTDPDSTTTPTTDPEPKTTPPTDPDSTTTPTTDPEPKTTPPTDPEPKTTPPTDPKSKTTPPTDPESKTTTPKTPKPITHPNSLLPKRCGLGPELDRIFGGTAAPLNAYPWMAVLGYATKTSKSLQYACGGSVINERYILTAAHCVDPAILRGATVKVVRLGEWDLKTRIDCEEINFGPKNCAPPAKEFTLEKIIMHPQYNVRTNYSDDIALIRLRRSIDLSGKTIQPVCLPPQNMDIRSEIGERRAVAAGWGFTEKGPRSSRLLNVFLPMFDLQSCNDSRHGVLVDEQICFGGKSGEDTCKGDSGGPLMVSGPHGPPFMQIGVVSYGATVCGTKNVAGVYTSVTHYRNWIEKNLRP